MCTGKNHTQTDPIYFVSIFSEMKHIYVGPTKRVTPASSRQQIGSSHFRVSSGLPMASDEYLSSFPKLITYDIFEKKSPQQLLYEVYKKSYFFFLIIYLENVFSINRALKNDLIPGVNRKRSRINGRSFRINGKSSRVNSRNMTAARAIEKI